MLLGFVHYQPASSYRLSVSWQSAPLLSGLFTTHGFLPSLRENQLFHSHLLLFLSDVQFPGTLLATWSESFAEQGAPEFLSKSAVLGTSASTAVGFAPCSCLLLWATWRQASCPLSTPLATFHKKLCSKFYLCLGFLPQRLGRPLILKILYMAFLSIHFKPGIKMLCSSQLYGKIFFSKTPRPKVIAHMHADDIWCWSDLSARANEIWQHIHSLRGMTLYLKSSKPIDYSSLCSPTDVNNWILPSGLHLGLRYFQIIWTGHKHRKNISVF